MTTEVLPVAGLVPWWWVVVAVCVGSAVGHALRSGWVRRLPAAGVAAWVAAGRAFWAVLAGGGGGGAEDWWWAGAVVVAAAVAMAVVSGGLF